MASKTSSRAAAFHALMAWERTHTFIDDSITRWKAHAAPSKLDVDLAYELACGTLRMQRYLDYQAKRVTANHKLPAKLAEKVLLRLALYQWFFLDRMPPHAIVNEMVALSKETASPHFARFINGLLRNIDREHAQVPENLADRYSYTDFFVEQLVQHYDQARAEKILQAENRPCPFMARLRCDPNAETRALLKDAIQDGQMYVFEGSAPIGAIAASPSFYIQNKTQPYLLWQCAKRLEKPPKTILDMCAAPGGKTVLLHDLFPTSMLVANDVSPAKVALLQENLTKYGIAARVHCGRGEELQLQELQLEQRFDLIVVDAPCSNSGVLYKCPEARWRLQKQAINELTQQQFRLLQSAARLLAPGGRIWYSTCSILPEENEALLEKIAPELGLELDGEPVMVLPGEMQYGEGGGIFGLVARL